MKKAEAIVKQQKKEETKNREKFNEKRINIFNKIHESKKLEAGNEISRIQEYEQGWKEKLQIVESLQQEKNEMAKKYLQQQKIQKQKVLSNLKEKERLEHESMNTSMNEIQQRLQETSLIQQELVEERASKLREENKKFEAKVTRFKMQTEEAKNQDYLDFEKSEVMKKKKLRVAYNSMNKMFKDFKEKRAEHWFSMGSRKADDS